MVPIAALMSMSLEKQLVSAMQRDTRYGAAA